MTSIVMKSFHIYESSTTKETQAVKNGFSVLLIAGEVDISIGSLLAFVSLPLIEIMNITGSVPLGIILCLIFGIIIGMSLFLYSVVSSTDNYVMFISISSLLLVIGGTLAATMIAYQGKYYHDTSLKYSKNK